jgi:DNA polymerase-1
MKSQIIYTKALLDELQEFITRHNITQFAFDTETDGLSHDRQMIGFSLAFKHSEQYLGYYVPVAHTSDDSLFAVEPSNVHDYYSFLEFLFYTKSHKIWIHNAKFDIKVLRNVGYDVYQFTEILDTLCVSWLLNPDRMGGHGLKRLVKEVLEYDMGSFSQFSSYDRNSDVPVGQMGKYAIDDAVYLLQLAHVLYPQLSQQLLKVFHELEMPIMRIVEEIEHFGFKVDKEKIRKAGVEMSAQIKQIEQEFLAMFGPRANIASTTWLNTLFDKEWGTVGVETGKSGLYKTNKDTLEKLQRGEIYGTTEKGKKVAELVLKHRKYSKLVSTYTTSLVEHCDSDSRIHGSFNQWGTATGRMSSSNPNLQNIPSSRSKEGDLLRKSFIAEKGYKLIVADYSQIELRVAGHLSNDKTVVDIYNNDGDIHQMTADACGCIRYDAKAINFGLIYKMGAKTLGGRINKTEEEAQEYSDKYFEKYSGIRTWQERMVAVCRNVGYTSTIIGRRRYLPDINSKKFGKKNSAERVAINTAVQGSAADIMKIGMRNFYRSMYSKDYSSNDFRVVGQVHDEIIVEAKESIAEEAMNTLQESMENAVKLRIKLVAEPELAGSWGEAK